MRLSKNVKYAVLALALACLGFGLWQLAGGAASGPVIRVLVAKQDIPVGARIDQATLDWVELPQAFGATYLAALPSSGGHATRSVAAGELLSIAAVSTAPVLGRSVVSIRPEVLPVQPLQIGDVVDVWTKPGTIVAKRAEVVAVTPDEAGFAASTKTVDLAVESIEVSGVLTLALADQPKFALVRVQGSAG